jgi:hypothetical protein
MDEIAENLKIEHCVFSMGDSFEELVLKNDVFYKGRASFVYNGYWKSPVVHNPTWQEMWKFADDAIKHKKDFERVHLKDAYPVDAESVDGATVMIFEFTLKNT